MHLSICQIHPPIEIAILCRYLLICIMNLFSIKNCINFFDGCSPVLNMPMGLWCFGIVLVARASKTVVLIMRCTRSGKVAVVHTVTRELQRWFSTATIFGSKLCGAIDGSVQNSSARSRAQSHDGCGHAP